MKRKYTHDDEAAAERFWGPVLDELSHSEILELIGRDNVLLEHVTRFGRKAPIVRKILLRKIAGPPSEALDASATNARSENDYLA